MTVVFSDDQNIPELWDNFLACIKSGQRPVCDIEIGHRSTNMSLLGMLSMKLGRSVAWDGEKWLRNDVPDFGYKKDLPDGTIEWTPPGSTAFIMLPEGAARLWAPGMADGPFPEHYEPLESPLDQHPFSNTKHNPAIIVWRPEETGTPDEYPIVCTTYRVTEHWQAGQMTRNLPWLVELMPQMFVEMSEELAELLSASGIGSDTHIVLYGDNNNWFAAWAYWQLKLYGLCARCDSETGGEFRRTAI